MLPFPSASGMFQQQMRGRLGFGPSNPPMGGIGNEHTPIHPLGGGLGQPAGNTGPLPPGRIMDGQGKLGGMGTGAVTGGMPNGGVVGPRSSPFGSPAAGGDSTSHAPGMGLPPVNTGPIGPNGPGGPYGGGSSTGPVESSQSSTGNIPGWDGGFNLNGSFNPGRPTPPTPFINFDSLNKPVPAGQLWDYGAAANTAIQGMTANPYGPSGVATQHSAGSLYPGGGTSYTPQGGMYGSSFSQAPQMMPDQFANMNYNLPVYGNIAPYPGA